MRVLPLIAILASAALLAGCPKKPTTVPQTESQTPVGQTAQAGASTSGTEAAGVGEARQLPGAGSPEQAASVKDVAAGYVVYFDFDSSEIKPEYNDLIAAQARRLVAHPALRVRLEGHTDERGSREYNIALGERRAQAVRRALLLQGVSDSQVVTVSYGEERPAVQGNTEEAYAKNRRVVFVDAG